MNEKITFPRLAAMLADRAGRSKRFSEDFLREFFAIISEMLEAGESVKVRGLGTFRLARVEPRMSVDVTTGQPMEIAGHSKVVFVPSKDLADAVNAPFEAFTAIEIGDGVDISQFFPEDEPLLQEATDPAPVGDFEEDSYLEDEAEVAPASAESIISFLIPEEKDSAASASLIPEPAFSIRIPSPVGRAAEDDQDDLPETTDLTDEPDSEPEEPSAYTRVIDLTEESLSEEPHSAGSETEAEDADESPSQTEKNREEEEPVALKEEEAVAEKPTVAVDMEEAVADDATVAADMKEDEAVAAKPQATVAKETEEGVADEEELVEEQGKSRRRVFLISLGAAMVALIGILAAWYVFFNADFSDRFLRTAQTPAQTHGSSEEGVGPNDGYPLGDSTVTQGDSIQERETEEVPTVPSDALVYDTISTTRYLTTMAKSHYGNYNLWPYIYEENKAILGHPDRIRPGTPVVIPDLRKYGVDPSNPSDIEKAKKMGMEIYSRYGKKI